MGLEGGHLFLGSKFRSNWVFCLSISMNWVIELLSRVMLYSYTCVKTICPSIGLYRVMFPVIYHFVASFFKLYFNEVMNSGLFAWGSRFVSLSDCICSLSGNEGNFPFSFGSWSSILSSLAFFILKLYNKPMLIHINKGEVPINQNISFWNSVLVRTKPELDLNKSWNKELT